MTKKIILCSGMRRSGSTWSFNVSRLIGEKVARDNKSVFTSTFRDSGNLDLILHDILSNEQNDIAVIKTHSLENFTIDLLRLDKIKNICTIRDPRDCVASYMRFVNETFEQSFTLVERSVQYALFYMLETDSKIIRYEEMMQEPKAQIKKISDYFETTLADNELEEIYQNTKIEKAAEIADNVATDNGRLTFEDGNYHHSIDHQTMLHEGHVNGGKVGRWQTELNAEQIQFMNKELGAAIKKLGYQLE